MLHKISKLSVCGFVYIRCAAEKYSGQWTRRLESPLPARLRAAQLVAVTRNSWALVAANIGNALVVLCAMWPTPRSRAALVWFVLLVAYLAPLVANLMKRRGQAHPQEVNSSVIAKATINAGILGFIWGMNPILFFNSEEPQQVVIISVCIGMLCGGAFSLSTIPFAVLAYVVPLAGCCLVALAFETQPQVHVLAIPLLLSYSSILIVAAFSHFQTFADRFISQIRSELAARHDPLTGLPNRLAFNHAIGEAFARLQKYGEKFAVFYIDLNEFKRVNDRWGHPVGDELLSNVAIRLRDAVEDRGILARIGGDEFAIVAPAVSDRNQAEKLTADLASCFEANFDLAVGQLKCGASVGSAIAPQDGATTGELQQSADAALYRDKVTLTLANRSILGADISRANRPRELRQDFKSGLLRNDFYLEYQPIFNLRNGELRACEALVRWRHPRHGVIPPAVFVEIAEKSGMIHELGEWILNQACEQAAAWPEGVRIAVNVSGAQLCDASFTGIVESALTKSGLAASRLQIEVTETMTLASEQEAAAALDRIHSNGVSIVLDDFGTGFSTFNHVNNLPVSHVKIDRSFVAQLPSLRSSAIVRSVVTLANALDIGVTAEGIETETQRAFLELAGCNLGQGYLLSKPLSLEAVLLLFNEKFKERRSVA